MHRTARQPTAGVADPPPLGRSPPAAAPRRTVRPGIGRPGPADRAGPAPRARRPRQRHVANSDLAAGRLFETAGDRQQCALAGPARAHDRYQLARIDAQVDVDQGVYFARAAAVDLAHPAKLQCAHRLAPVGAVDADAAGDVRVVRAGPSLGTGTSPSTAERRNRLWAASSQRTTESSRYSSASTTNAKLTSWAGASRLIRVHSCISWTTCRRCVWITSCTSTPGTRVATRTLITSSSRGGELRSGGVRSQLLSSVAPVRVSRNAFCALASASLSDSTRPSRSSRCSVV